MKDYDVVIIGAGVSGTALAYTLSNFTNIKRIALVEKHTDVAQVSSHFTQNSQTLHFGDIESNYDFKKASQVKDKTELVRKYIESVGKKDGVFTKTHKMLLAVGQEEVTLLQERYKQFKKIFTKIKLLDREGIKKYEPKVIEGRDPKQPVAALWSPDGYTMDYYALSKSFLKHTKKVDVMLKTSVNSLRKDGEHYIVSTSKGELRCSVLVSDAGGMSIYFAKMLGYGKHLTIMSLGGNFYRGPEALNGKVYTMQHPKRPNAAIHGDPDVREKGYTRFGPTANILLSLERYNTKTVNHYFSTVNYTPRGIYSIIKTGLDPAYGLYVIENMLYDLPIIGKYLLNRHIKKIIPTIKASQLHKDKGYGGARPQIIDARQLKVNLGEARIEGDRAIFNITPSPGASTCLANAVTDTKRITGWLDTAFKEKQFKKTRA